MIDTRQVQKIVDVTSSICGHELIFIDTNEKIIAAYNKERIGNYHKGITKVLIDRDIILSPDEDAKKSGVFGGMVLPIVVNDEVIGAIGITGKPEEVGSYGALVKHQVEMMYTQSILFEASKTKEDTKNMFVRELLGLNNRETLDLRLIRSLGNFLNFDLNASYIVILGSVDSSNEVALSSNTDLLLRREFFEKLEQELDETGDLIKKISSTLFIIIKKINNVELIEIKSFVIKLQKEFIEKYYSKYYISVGEYYEGISGIRKSFNDADNIIRLVDKMNYDKGVYCWEDIQIPRILNDVKPETKENILSNPKYLILLEDGMKWLLKTAHVFIENDLNMTKSALVLHIHRNSLNYRLNKIEEITDLNLRKAKDAFEFYLIYMLVDLD